MEAGRALAIIAVVSGTAVICFGLYNTIHFATESSWLYTAISVFETTAGLLLTYIGVTRLFRE